MFDDFTMFVRFALMIVVGTLINQGFVDSSLSEPIIGIGLAGATLAWKYWERKHTK